MTIVGVDDLELDPVVEAATVPRELDHFHDVDLDKILFRIVKSKKLANVDVRSTVLDGHIEDSIDATPNISLTIRDPDWELLNSGALSRIIDIKVGNRWYRLSTVEVADDDLTCTFIIRNAKYLMYQNRRRKVSRDKSTRAEFIRLLVKSVKKVKIKFFCKQLHKKQKIEGLRINRDEKRQRGLPAKGDSTITVKGQEADSEQRKNIEAVIDVGEDMNGPRRALVGALMCIIQEAEARRSATAGQFVGLFQQSSRYGWPATRDPRKDAPAFYEKFIPLVKASPQADLGILIARVQRPLHPDEYALGCNRWRDEAEDAVDQYVGGGGLSSREFRKRYDYETEENADGTNENYLAAIYRLAEEVNWRAYWVGNDLHYASEEDLFKSRPRTRIERDDEAIEGISFQIDEQREANQMTLSVRMVKWFAPVGTVVVFGPKPKGKNKKVAKAKIADNPANGNWLVTNIRRPVFNELGEITLSKPVEEKLEPAPEIGTRQVDDGSGGADSLGGSFGGSGAIDDSEGARGIVESCAMIAGSINPAATARTNGVFVVSDWRPNSTTTGGSPSDHGSNNADQAARDIAYDGYDALTGPPHRQLDLAMKRIAEAFDFEYTPGDTIIKTLENWNGYRVQFIWRTPLYGGHMGHIHVGARRVAPPPQPKYGRN